MVLLYMLGDGYFSSNFTFIRNPAASPLSMSALILEHLAPRSIKLKLMHSRVSWVLWVESKLCYLTLELSLSSLRSEWVIYIYDVCLGLIKVCAQILTRGRHSPLTFICLFVSRTSWIKKIKLSRQLHGMEGEGTLFQNISLGRTRIFHLWSRIAFFMKHLPPYFCSLFIRVSRRFGVGVRLSYHNQCT